MYEWIANVGAYVEKPEVISAIATVVIAVFTIALWTVTYGQLRHLKRQFNATYRPEVVVHAIAPHFPVSDGLELIGASVWCFNKGKALALRLEIRATITRTATLPVGHEWEEIETRTDSIRRGGKHQFYVRSRYSRREETNRQGGQIRVGDPKLFLIGTIAYWDEVGTRFETGFCRVFSAGEGAWKSADMPEHEYAY